MAPGNTTDHCAGCARRIYREARFDPVYGHGWSKRGRFFLYDKGMSTYRRARVAGGCYFFTLVTRNRVPWLADDAAIRRLRAAFRKIRVNRPFTLDAAVILPDHLHVIWRLPEGDADYPTRWRLIKHYVSTAPDTRWRWQARYWEHLIRDERDWRRHVAYIHYNPVKHGYVQSPCDWPYSSFRRAVHKGWHDLSWVHPNQPICRQ